MAIPVQPAQCSMVVVCWASRGWGWLMSGFWEAPNDYAYDNGTFNGSAHSVSSETAPSDPAEAVRKVVEEVTGKPLPVKPAVRIGFY